MGKIRLAGKEYSIGGTLNTEELTKLANKSGYTLDSIIRRAKDQGFDVSSGAKTYTPPPQTSVSSPTPFSVNTTQITGTYSNPSPSDEIGGMSLDQAGEYNFQSGLLTLKGNIEQELEKLRGATALQQTEVSTARELEARKYVVDREALTNENVTNIQARNRLDLQGIVNAGNAEVENIRGATERETARITGEFGLKGEETRQAGQRAIANIQAQAGLRNALVGAFSF